MSKRVIDAHKISDAASLAADYTSDAIDVSFVDNLGLEAQWTGTPSGSLFIQGSNSGINWRNITTSVGTLTGSAGSGSIILNNFPFSKARIFFDRTGGDGALNAWITGKEI